MCSAASSTNVLAELHEVMPASLGYNVTFVANYAPAGVSAVSAIAFRELPTRSEMLRHQKDAKGKGRS